MKRTFLIQRFWPQYDDKPYWQRYEIDYEPEWMVLDGLSAVKAIDPAFAYRQSCRHGICGACAMNVNGLNRLACETRMVDLPEMVKIRPLPGFPVIRDLVVDLTKLYENYAAVKPYLIASSPPPEREYTQTPEQRAQLDGLYECILCGACTSACPTFWANDEFLGPQALLQACRFVKDSRDVGLSGRKEILEDSLRCHAILNCNAACPKQLRPFEAINNLGLRGRLAGLVKKLRLALKPL